MKLWLRNRLNFIKAQKEVKDYVGKWWSVKCQHYVLGKVKVSKACEIPWSDNFPPEGDYREPFHVWVEECTVSSKKENAEWVITPTEESLGILTDEEGKVAFRRLTDAHYHMLTSDQKGFYIHTQLLKG